MSDAAKAVNQFVISHPIAGPMLGMPGRTFTPIVPSRERPEIQSTDYPWIVYARRRVTDPDAWWENIDELTYVIYHTDIDKIEDLSDVLYKEFKKMDESAQAINAWLGEIGYQTDVQFLTIRVTNDLTAGPPDQEGGVFAKLFVIRYTYVVDSDSA